MANPTEESNVVRPLAFQRDDGAWVAELRRGTPQARQLLFERHASHVTRVLARLLGTEVELSDLVHDVFMMALRDLKKLKEPGALKAWLTSIAVFIARGHIRKKTRHRWLRFLDPQELPEAPAPSASGEMRYAIRRTYAILDTLPEGERLAFALRFIDQMELKEAAEACGVSLATLKRWLTRAEAAFTEQARRDPVLRSWLETGARWGNR
jgi:RNA polymerase sigma-70 factor (ECF subfamily)